MKISVRLAIVSSIASALLLAGAACKGGEATQPENPKPPAQPSPSPTAPAPQQKAEGTQAPAAPEGQKEEPAAKAEVTPEAKKEADDLFASLCSTCHGADGSGNGPAAAAFPTKPASFASADFQKSVSDEQIAKAIVGGGAAVGKSPLMPANPNLEGKPAVVAALVQKIRDFGNQ
ncbi:MAG TPA: c-type cytochrome [Vulgatibacter sp.]|nr:c-type cytochrome [Vulgatibacter sp.]